MAAMTSFHAEKSYCLVSVHEVSAARLGLCGSVGQFLIYRTFLLVSKFLTEDNAPELVFNGLQ